jgi:hypothetical protein
VPAENPASTGNDVIQKSIRESNILFAAIDFLAKAGGTSGFEPTSQNRLMSELLTSGVIELLKKPEVIANMEGVGYSAAQSVRLNAARWPHTLDDLKELVDWFRTNECYEAADAFVKGVTLVEPLAATNISERNEPLAAPPTPPPSPGATPPHGPQSSPRGR